MNHRCPTTAQVLIALWVLHAVNAFAVSPKSSVVFPGRGGGGFRPGPSIVARGGDEGRATTTSVHQQLDPAEENSSVADESKNLPVSTETTTLTDPPPPKPEKSEDNDFLKDALLQNVLFTNLPEESLQALIESFERVECNQNDVICRQGDSCENGYVYVIGTGQCLVEVDGKPVPRPYGTLRSKAIFGELGILYNHTRRATISCRTPKVSLYRIPGNDFKNILNKRIPLVADGDEAKELQEIDNVIREIEGTKSMYEGAIIRPYKPNRAWLWRCFTGTILQHVALPTLLSMLWSLCFVLFARHKLGLPIWSWGLPPDPTNPFVTKLRMVHKIWSYQQGLTTFILTFFLNQAFMFWQEILGIGRRIQGRLNDFNLLLSSTAIRKKDGSYTSKAEHLLDDIGQISRLFHALMWAATAKRFSVLLTPQGLERMAARGLMTSKQLQVLQSLDLNENQKHTACLQWMMIRTDRGIQEGALNSDDAYRQLFCSTMTTLRSTYATIGDKLDGRMPLAYTHIVQVLVDTFVWTAPIALFSELGAWSIICVGVLTLFYTGMLGLAKIFLDPLNNENFCRNSIYMDIGVLIRESNAGSTRWANGAAKIPF